MAGTIELGGRPEYAAADGAGHVFVNLVDGHAVLNLDSRKLTVAGRWPVAPGKNPASPAIDRRNCRLFVGCRNRPMVVVNADSGKVVADLPIGDRVDATAFDPGTGIGTSP